MDNIDDVLNVVERWGTLGLLDGLPILDKTELAQIYDNATRLMLSTVAIKKIPKNISNIYDEVYIPICRRLYKRLGPNFNLDTMMSQLLEVVNKGGKDIFKVDSENPTDNPIVDFCVDFADGYEDEEYQEKINKVLDITKSVLLNESLVSYVNNSNGEYKIELSKAKKNTQQTRFWNQSVAKSFVNSTLSEINKGL